MPDQTGLFVNVNKEKYDSKVSTFATTPEGFYYPTFRGDSSIYNKHKKNKHFKVVRETDQDILKQVAPIHLSWWL